MGNSVGYKGCLPSGPSYAELLHAIDGYLPRARLSNKRKFELISHQPPPGNWDNLSKVRLTTRALTEFDRRAAQIALDLLLPQLPPKKPRRPLTRQYLAERKSDRLKETCQSASEFLDNCDAKCLTEIKRLARHGGPDMSNLRGV
jgi:hypothetical protein